MKRYAFSFFGFGKEKVTSPSKLSRTVVYVMSILNHVAELASRCVETLNAAELIHGEDLSSIYIELEHFDLNLEVPSGFKIPIILSEVLDLDPDEDVDKNHAVKVMQAADKMCLKLIAAGIGAEEVGQYRVKLKQITDVVAASPLMKIAAGLGH